MPNVEMRMLKHVSYYIVVPEAEKWVKAFRKCRKEMHNAEELRRKFFWEDEKKNVIGLEGENENQYDMG